jgi:ABC-type lipoprotein release transport system permease subunit
MQKATGWKACATRQRNGPSLTLPARPTPTPNYTMLTFTKLVARSAAYHARGNFAVLLGVAVGSAVLTGALLVGDSLRGSLRARAERQLGGIDAAALLPRPVRAELADALPNTKPVLLLPGSLQAAGSPATAARLGRVTVLGVDDRFAPHGAKAEWGGNAKQIALSARVAEKLSAKAGDKVRLGVEKFGDLPRSSSLAERDTDSSTATEEYEVVAVLPADAAEGDFNLSPNPAAPLNVFVPLRALARLATGRPNPVCTALLATGTSADELNATLRTKLKAEDYGVKFRDIDRKQGRGGYVSVESTELVFPPRTVAGIEAAARALNVRAEPTVVYVADTLAAGSKEIPFPIVAGLNTLAASPLSPIELAPQPAPSGPRELGDDEVDLLEWPGSELNGLQPGTKIRLVYFDPEIEGEGLKREAQLTLRGYVPFKGAARDKDLTPEIPGVTDPRAELRNWNRPPVLPKVEIERRVPEKPKAHPRGTFFTQHKAVPMAYMNTATARKLFKSRYGTDTSVRVAPADGEALDKLIERLQAELPKHLDPKAAGLAFDPIRERLFTASKGGTDFGGLFLGFSLFLIVAALMLVGLMFRLALERRAKQIGLLLATGYSVRAVRRMLLAEGLAVAVIGALIGLAAGVAYNRLLLGVLLDLWPDSEVRTYLKPHASALTFALGFGLTLVMSLVALWFSVRGLVKVPPPALLRGETTIPGTAAQGSSRRLRVLAPLALIGGAASIVAGGGIDNPDFRAMSFFGGGALLLTAALCFARMWMTRTRHGVTNGRGASALAQLGARNAARNPGRSLLTASLIASAAFLLVAVESFRRQPDKEFLNVNGGSGGFNLLAESSSPLFQPFDAGLGRADLEKQLRKAFAPPADGEVPETPEFQKAKADLSANLEAAFALRLRGGDDASCANLFQASRPRVLGVPQALIDRGGFKFYMTAAQTPEEKANPWLLLTKRDGDAIPVFCEQNTAQWMLKKGIGDDYTLPGDDGRDVTFRIVGTLVDSPFQSELICSEADFTQTFPKQAGFRAFLVRTKPGAEADVARLLEIGFRASGFGATPTRDKVASYQAVIGAYLSTFQLLGGFGLLLGVLGLGVVILRGVWERLGELALMRAMGYRTRALQVLVLIENALLLAVGVGSGVLCAAVSVAPHVASGAEVPFARLAALLGLVLAAGFVVAFAATAGILRVPVIPALRRE